MTNLIHHIISARLAKAAKSRKHNRGAETVVEQKSDVPAR